MSTKQRRDQRNRPPREAPPWGTPFFVMTVAEEAGRTTFALKITPGSFEPTKRFLAADCARAAIRNGLPELQFAQLDPRNNGKAAALTILRYDMDLFRSRWNSIREQAGIQDLIDTTGDATKRPKELGSFCDLLDRADLSESQLLVTDVELEFASWNGHRATMIFFRAESETEKLNALLTKPGSYVLAQTIAVTMHVAAMADLFVSWRSLVERIQK